MDIFAWLNDQLLRMNWLSELVRLLEEYRGAPSNATLDQLAIDYDIDRAVLQRLVRFVSVPDEQPLPPAA